MQRVSFIGLRVACAIASAAVACAQNPPSALPQDPLALMKLAHQKNGLTGPDITPWHVHGTYRSYKNGKPEYAGTYEEWWISPTQYKVSFVSPKHVQTDYATGTALLREGEQDWLGGPELFLRFSLVDPLPAPSELKPFTLHRSSLSVGQAKLACVELKYKVKSGPDVTNFFPSACFESTMPVLRIFNYGDMQVRYDHIVLVQGHFIAHQIQLFSSGRLTADLSLDPVGVPNQSPEVLLTAPASALKLDLSRIVVKAYYRFWPIPLIIAGPEFALTYEAGPIGIHPDQPNETKAEPYGPKIEYDTVVVSVDIGPDGHVEKTDAVSGPYQLQPSAVAAARQWVFRPFVAMGEARPVDMQIPFSIPILER